MVKQGASIRRRRKQLGWGQEDLAARALLHKDTIVKAEKSHPVTDATRDAIEAALSDEEARRRSDQSFHTPGELSLSANSTNKGVPDAQAGTVTVRSDDLAAIQDLARRLLLAVSAVIDGPRTTEETERDSQGTSSHSKTTGRHGV